MNSSRIELLKNYQNPIYQVDLTSYTLVELIEEMTRRIPQETALVYEGEQYTYAEINKKANQIGQAILDLDDSFPQVVAALADNGSKMYFMELGILKARKVLVGLLPAQPLARLTEIIHDSGARILVYISENQDLAENLAEKSGLTLLNIDHIREGRESNLQLEYRPDDTVTIAYTSGSTGKPKGISQSNLAILHSVGVHAGMGMDASERFFSIYNFSYGNGITAPFKAWLVGGVVYPFDLNKKGLSELVDLIRQEELTVYHTPPSVFRNFIKSVVPGSLPSLRWIHLGGEPVVIRDIELFKEKFLPGCRIFNNLGSSEAASLLRYIMDHDTELIDGVVPIGYPSARAHLQIVDEQGHQVESGQVGELVVRSKYLSLGYWNDPKMTAEKFLPVEGSTERLFFTGDLVYQRPDGCYIYAGRKDSQVKVRGSRVIVSELEATISRQPGVAQVVIRVDQIAGDAVRLHAYVIPEQGRDLTSGELRKRLAKTLPIHMLPHQVTLLNEFPRTPSGKIDRKSLPSPDSNRPALAYAPEPPASEAEETLAAIWEKIFQMEGIGVRDNFFDLGGDSLQAAELFVEIEKAFGRRFPISLLVQASNIRQQADLVQTIQEKDPWLPLVEFNPKGDQPPLFCFAGKGGNPIKFREMALALGEDQPVFFLQSRGLSGQDQLFTSVEEIATDYLQAMRQVQPEGPYRLLGSSFGGKVAFELASQLSLKGEKVDFVMMLDTFATGYPKYLNEKPKYTLRVIKGFEYLKKHWQSLSRGTWQERLSYLKYYWDLIPVTIQERNRQRRLKIEAKDRQIAMSEALKRVEQTNVQASSRYQAGSFSGRVVILRALEQPADIIEDPTLGWGSAEIGELIIHAVEGHHGNLLMPPYVNQVVDLLKLYLNGNTDIGHD